MIEVMQKVAAGAELPCCAAGLEARSVIGSAPSKAELRRTESEDGSKPGGDAADGGTSSCAAGLGAPSVVGTRPMEVAAGGETQTCAAQPGPRSAVGSEQV